MLSSYTACRDKNNIPYNIRGNFFFFCPSYFHTKDYAILALRFRRVPTRITFLYTWFYYGVRRTLSHYSLQDVRWNIDIFVQTLEQRDTNKMHTTESFTPGRVLTAHGAWLVPFRRSTYETYSSNVTCLPKRTLLNRVKFLPFYAKHEMPV